MSEIEAQFTAAELYEWNQRLQEADRYNILCHCRDCDWEWIASVAEVCRCGSRNVEWIACWQFPDD